MIAVVALVASFASSLLLVGWLIRLAPRFELFAHPNARSSHDSATPTMGGIAIVLPVLMALLLVAVRPAGASMQGLAAAAAVLAVVGFLDDLYELGAGVRLCCQTVAVVLFLYPLDLALAPVWLAMVGLLLLWHVNLFNFMDGIDGIAGVQTLIFCTGAIVLSGGGGLLLWTLAGATLGFLAYNWPPARIFMGDVGSLFLGLILGALVIELHRTAEMPFVASIILLSGFWIDASYTLCVRILTGQRFTEAHRSHLYQRLSDRIGHRGATSLFGLMGVFWLFPLAWLAARHTAWSAFFLLLAAAPYLLGAVVLRAGLPDDDGPGIRIQS